MRTRNFLTNSNIHSPNDIYKVLDIISDDFNSISENTKYKTINLPISFDIETSSFYDTNGNKTAIMYEWSLCIDGLVLIGRTWDEFLEVLDVMINEWDISVMNRLVIYVHNLSFEFQFIQHLFKWNKVFAISQRKPIYAMTTTGIIFRCSYLLSGYSLFKLAENLTTVDIKKMVGDLDYKLIRHSKTELTQEELGYCVNDVKIVVAYILERMEKDGNILKIPNTKTGYVRRYCKENCFFDDVGFRYKSRKYQNYRLMMEGLSLDPDEYQQLIRAFSGGFTHANPMYSNRLCYDIGSDDLTSSYPTVMVSERYPMSKGELVQITSIKDFFNNLKLYCCIFDIQFIGLEPRVYFDNYISESKTWGGVNIISQNGRVVSADSLYTTITDVDFSIIQRFYKWKSMKIGCFRRYKRGYLPTDLIKSVLQLYKDKTELKGVMGKEAEYLNAKEQVNSAYG